MNQTMLLSCENSVSIISVYISVCSVYITVETVLFGLFKGLVELPFPAHIERVGDLTDIPEEIGPAEGLEVHIWLAFTLPLLHKTHVIVQIS